MIKVVRKSKVAKQILFMKVLPLCCKKSADTWRNGGTKDDAGSENCNRQPPVEWKHAIPQTTDDYFLFGFHVSVANL